jgi:hypothetical protein
LILAEAEMQIAEVNESQVRRGRMSRNPITGPMCISKASIRIVISGCLTQ